MASQQSARQPGLNPAQVRHVLATLAHVDAGFRHIESVIASRPTPFAREQVDVTADEAQVLASFMAAARVRMLETCERLGIPAPRPDVSGRLSIETTLHFAGIAFADMSPGVLERPFVHYLPPDAKPGTADPADNNTSFFSGHTTIAFAIATASGTVADLRGYPSAPLIWTAGLAVATTTAYLRIAADKHYLTDVVAGGAVGALVGLAVPRLFHHRSDVQVAYGAGGAPGLTITWLSR